MRSGPFLMSNSGNGSHGQAASYAFGFVKNIYFFKSYSRKLFVIKKTQLDFLKKNIFKKSKILIFQNFENFDFHWLFKKKLEKMSFSKIKILDFWKVFFKNSFSKNRVWLFGSQKVFGCNFWKNKYFFTNPKAYEAACPWLPFPLLDIKNGPLRKKLSPKNLGVPF